MIPQNLGCFVRYGSSTPKFTKHTDATDQSYILYYKEEKSIAFDL
jgi:hypothetical protein